jgi:hypothetical protein
MASNKAKIIIKKCMGISRSIISYSFQIKYVFVIMRAEVAKGSLTF